MYNTNRPDGTPQDETAIIINRNIKHNELGNYKGINLQLNIEECSRTLTISEIYYTPKNKNKRREIWTLFGNK